MARPGAHTNGMATMNTLTSRDGTTIAYDQQGEGQALILVDGALTVHSSGSGAELAKLLAPHFTVYGFDRRGRGESGDTLPYAVDREIDDIEALVDRADGPAFLYGHSPRRPRAGNPGSGRPDRPRPYRGPGPCCSDRHRR